MPEGLIFDIKRYAINDGPGIRVVVFFKGCNLHCTWCHNPESISPKPEKLYTSSKCIWCGTCVDACPVNALELTAGGIVTDNLLCTACGTCADVCPTKAIEMSGKAMSVAEIMESIENDKVFFDQSGGGVTFSGGEPLLQSKMLTDLLDECGRQGIHRAVDTAGNIPAAVLLDIAERTDLFLFDLKVMDPGVHEQWTGIRNDRILENLKILAETGVRIIIRIPLVAGVNDDKENIRATAEFISSLPGQAPEVQLLIYHAIASHKYAKLGRENDFVILEEPDQATIEQVILWFSEYGIIACTG